MSRQIKKLDMTVANNIRWLCKRLGVEQQQVALKAGIGIRSLAYILKGRDCQISTVKAIAKVFSLTDGQLLSPTLPTDYDNREWLERIRKLFNMEDPGRLDLIKRATESTEQLSKAESAVKRTKK